VSGFLPVMIENLRADPSGTYKSWFLWEERIKNLCSIRTDHLAGSGHPAGSRKNVSEGA
jgi:hypothetical protein